MKNTTTPAEKYQAAVAAARAAETAGMSTSTMNKRWKAVFAAEDAMKASGAWL